MTVQQRQCACQASGTTRAGAQRRVQRVSPTRRALLASLAGAAPLLAASGAQRAQASGIESIDIPMPDRPRMPSKAGQKAEEAVAAAEKSFQESELLKTLRDNSIANKDKNRRAITDKYCQRQAELGVGDCGGLRFIPGATKSGKQKAPEWLAKLFGFNEYASGT